MDEFDIDDIADPELEEPVLVEGLPGVGHVGKLAAEHLLEELDSELVRRVYSTHFPPQVSVEDGRTQLACAEFHAVTPEDGRDMLVLTGDHQAQDNEGHYGLTSTFLDIGEAFGVEEVYALGGVPTGELIEEYDVLGATTTDDFGDRLEDAGVEFREDEPAGGIVGVSGLLLGLSDRRDLPAACLMGETSGYLVDPKSAQAVLEILQEVVGFEVPFDPLEERADEMEEVVRKIQQMEEQNAPSPADEDLRYIG
ncbi:proteasome assembly chaperone family protein [Haloarcula salinisoli]|uniref:Proteasome assembly chaperone family protein n=1 Tax=Haloarcula salinisoli TaxID=2487746 RepID=A0A8J7YKH6_9EURY|nr:proteasome assembly chaperone family protein [Halomicroarcula salinisoli]MBX0285653.1 proteasome assembly chaperone family protein [Halomicroarcula salinisoli]MBX0302858.1 proteasome assembly chaperone family protein [Halomicroarcula salinisoli]